MSLPRVCTICQHPERGSIDEALLDGGAYRGIARRFGASASAVYRHSDHIPRGLVKAQEAVEATRADDLLGQVRDLQRRTLGVLTQAESTGDLRAATGAIREARGCLELLGKLAGQLAEKHIHAHAHAHQITWVDIARRAAQRQVGG